MNTDITHRVAAYWAALWLGLAPGLALADVANTVHNLTPTGPGGIKNPDPVGLCRFCHTPHGAGQSAALWNHELPTEVYTLYESSTLEAALEQPTGSSRLCLSCHDGTVALGNLFRTGSDAIAGLAPLEGRGRLDADLSDDHPVSFVFDEALAVRSGELVSPGTLTGSVRLDASGQLQCTACHDPHEDRFPSFLVASNERSELCEACHAKRGWSDSSHATSEAAWTGFGEDPWPESDFDTVSQNGCLSCHDPHGAARPQRLLARSAEDETCLVCHSGNVAEQDVRGQLDKISAHPVGATGALHDPAENPSSMERHVACSDCHNPHAVVATSSGAPELPGSQRLVSGMDVAGAPVEESEFAYEVCLRCHGVSDAPQPRVLRMDPVSNVRLEIDPANSSYHPVASIGTNPLTGTLIAPLTPASWIYCHDCHNTDESELPGPTTPLGPHGSSEEPILAGAYPLVDRAAESSATYGLCYRCHDRQRLLAPGGFGHGTHVQERGASCAVCHDAHGSRTSTHLLNFMRFDEAGAEVVRPSASTGLLLFEDLGLESGRCFLACHGSEHGPKEY